MDARLSRWLATASVTLGFALVLGAAPACSAPASDEDEVGAAEDALTLPNGDEYIVAVDRTSVTLRKSFGVKALRFVAGDFANKSVLIHPIDKKTESGVYAHVESVEDRGETLVLHTRPLELAEMENTRGLDVIRLYRDSRLTVAPSVPQPAAFAGANLLPSGFVSPVVTAGIRPLAFSGPLATGELEPELWVGNKHVYGSGQITTTVESAKLAFKPSAILDYTPGKGLTVGIRGDFSADLALRAKGSAEGHVVFYDSPVLKSPRVTFVVPIGIPPFVVPVPVVIGVDTFIECSTLGEVAFDGVFKAHLGLGASASAIVHPSILHPVNQWVTKGPWPNKVTASASFTTLPGSKLSGAGGLACAVPRIEFPVTLAGLVGPFLAIHPEFAQTTEGFHTTVDLYAGAASEIGNERFFELLLLRWEPGQGEK